MSALRIKSLYKSVDKVLGYVVVTYLLFQSVFFVPLLLEKKWEEKIYVVESQWLYTLLSPTSPHSLGKAYLYFGYVNKARADAKGVDVEGLIRHEAKHLSMVNHIGIKDFLLLEEWKNEGLAEYERDNPTLNPCDDSVGSTEMERLYRDYFVVVSYLRDNKQLTEVEILNIADYPLKEASEWYLAARCDAYKGLVI